MSDAQTLTQTLGGEWRGHTGLAPCPVCQTERRADQRGLSIRAEGGALLAFCHKTGCDFRDIVRAAGLPRDSVRIDPVAQRVAEAKREAYAVEQLAKARRLWAICKPLQRTKGETYLRGRGITCPLPPSLGWAADAFHAPSARWLSAMVGDVSTGGVHRTYFEKSGRRIIEHSKMMQGPCAGGAVALSEASGPLVVCEGIETGLSLLSGLLAGPATVWAALSTSGMKALALPKPPGQLIVATDSDDVGAGWQAGNALAERAAALGWAVSMLPAPEGQDWNDALRGGIAA
ncbi:MAG: Virulence-associated protein [Cypionkella sp.]|uniref:toprim domain-containing protein n=1 Tax=Cypionkella sp. TaxID=2811411 RepID=UPI002610D6EB|nr:toprim domain-containing protein [Cypionkella sp.]MDB5660450.1 Virulence-associated protein [Cypionkella sp.]